VTRALLLVALLAGTAVADGTKKKPDKFQQAAGEAFDEATKADRDGDLRTALGLYQKAFEISPHPSTAYNMGDVQRRLGDIKAAIRSFETYLVLAPNAPDRKQVDATLDKLVKTRGTLILVSPPASDPNAVDLLKAYILVDGVLVMKPHAQKGSIEVEVDAGEHTIDVVTSLTYGTSTCRVGPTERYDCYVRAKPRIDGHVVVSIGDRGISALTEPRGKRLADERFDLPAGRRMLLVRDRSYECPVVTLDVPSGNDIAYVYISSSEYEFERCRQLEVKPLRLRFE